MEHFEDDDDNDNDSDDIKDVSVHGSWITRRYPRRQAILRASMREVSRSLAKEHGDQLTKKSRNEPLLAALDLLKKLGGAVALHEMDGKKFISRQELSACRNNSALPGCLADQAIQLGRVPDHRLGDQHAWRTDTIAAFNFLHHIFVDELPAGVFRVRSIGVA